MTHDPDPAAGGNPAHKNDEAAEDKGASSRASEAEDREAAVLRTEGSIRARAETHGGLLPLEQTPKPYRVRRQPRLPDPVEEQAVASGSASWDFEAELAGIVAECRFLMREVAFHSARLTPDADDRIRFLDSACRLADTGARIAESAARLRVGPQSVEEQRKTLTYEVVHRTLPPEPPLRQEEGGTL